MTVQSETRMNMFNFSTYVSRDISSMPTRIVEGIRIYFGYNAVYGIRELDREGNVKILEFYGDGIYKRDHSLYKEKLVKTDLFETNLSKIIGEATAKGKMVWRVQDIGYSPEDFFETEYGKLAGKSGFGYKAAIVSPQPLDKYYHSLSIYKNKFQGDFTPDELDFLEQLATLFNVFLSAYFEHLRHQAILAVFNYKATKDNRQVCVMDSHLTPLFKTADFDVQCNKLFKKREFNEFVLSLAGDIAQLDSEILYEESCELDGEPASLRVCVYVPEIELSFNDSKLISVTITRTPSTEQEPSPGSPKLNSYGFTAREFDVIELLIRNHSIDDIAEKLFMAKPTVRTHISHIYRKLGVSNRLEAMSKLR